MEVSQVKGRETSCPLSCLRLSEGHGHNILRKKNLQSCTDQLLNKLDLFGYSPKSKQLATMAAHFHLEELY